MGPATSSEPAYPATAVGAATDGTAAGGWLVRIGSFEGQAAARRGWSELRGSHADLLGALTRLPAATGGTQAVLAGPVASEAEAERICGGLAAEAVPCQKLRM
jgi:cell division septation protein DedD